jgi:hypothetical protein
MGDPSAGFCREVRKEPFEKNCSKGDARRETLEEAGM